MMDYLTRRGNEHLAGREHKRCISQTVEAMNNRGNEHLASRQHKRWSRRPAEAMKALFYGAHTKSQSKQIFLTLKFTTGKAEGRRITRT